MVIREYGVEHPKTLLFFQSTAENYTDFLDAVSLLAKDFHVLLFAPDGHDESVRDDFISIEESVEEATSWLKAQNIEHLDAVYGLSMGGGMAMRMIALQEIPIDRAIIDGGVAPYTYPKWICRLIAWRDYLAMKLVYHNRKLLEVAAPPERYTPKGKDPKAVYDESFRYLQTYSDRTIRNVFWSANNYAMPYPAPDVATQMEFWYGADEKRSRARDLKWAVRYFPRMEVREIPGMDHGEYVLIHPEEFYQTAMRFLHREA